MNSFIGWVGGKRLLRKEIVDRFPDNIDRYIEVFGGAGWVLFYKDKHAKLEVFNDCNSELVNLYRCIKYHFEELKRELSWTLNSRDMFNDFLEQYNLRGMTDIQRAARYFILIKTSYGSKVDSYGCNSKNLEKSIDYLEDIQSRLNKVVVENKDFENLIKVYDKPGALFYLDPPYYGTEHYYNEVSFLKEDHSRLKSVVDKIKGKFILSYNDCKEIREMYKDYYIEEIVRNSNLKNRYENKSHKYCELIIKNY